MPGAWPAAHAGAASVHAGVGADAGGAGRVLADVAAAVETTNAAPSGRPSALQVGDEVGDPELLLVVRRGGRVRAARIRGRRAGQDDAPAPDPASVLQSSSSPT